MAKEWILNIATNRWGLNKKNSVGPVSQWIRECSPKTIKDWEKFYYSKLSEFLKSKGINLSPQEYIEDLGRKLYVKITEVIQAEIEEVTEEDCIQYIHNLVINRTYDGYLTEIKTIYGKLQHDLGVKIKPITYEQTPEIYRWKEWLSKTHDKFEKDHGGKVFIIFSIKKDNKKEIYNPEVIEEIKKEILRLKK